MQVSVIIHQVKDCNIFLYKNNLKNNQIEFLILGKEKYENIENLNIKYFDENISLPNIIKETSYDFILFLESSDILLSDFNYIEKNLKYDAILFSVLKNSYEGFYSKREFIRNEGFLKENLQKYPKFATLYKKEYLLSFIKDNKINFPQSSNCYYINKFYTINKVDIKIDYVVPYVNNLDLEWLKIYQYYKNKENVDLYKDYEKSEKNFASGIQRFRDDGNLLKFIFRGIEKNLPWINNVFLLVMQESQVPKWINTDIVKIIYHKDFIPKEYLPTFCSNTIEMFLWNIPGLSENFIYANDDMFIIKPQQPYLWFKNGKPMFYCNIRDRDFEKSGDIIRNQHYQLLLNSKNENLVIDEQHGIFPLKKSLVKECYLKYKDQINNSISTFRNPKNYNQWLFSNYIWLQNKSIQKKRKLFCRMINNRNRDSLQNLNLGDFTEICLNDGGEEQTVLDTINIVEKFTKFFPKISKFEKLQNSPFKVMSLGGSCADIYILGNDIRIKGPLDNVFLKKGILIIEDILNKKLEEKFFKESYIREKNNSFFDNDYFGNRKKIEFKTVFKDFDIIHNDFLDEKYQEALKERIKILYEYIDNIQNQKNSFLAYFLSIGDFDENKNLNFENILKIKNLLISKNLWNKTIIVGQKILNPSLYEGIYPRADDSLYEILKDHYICIYNTKLKENLIPIEKRLSQSQNQFRDFLNQFAFNLYII